jgi:hypothetical protein
VNKYNFKSKIPRQTLGKEEIKNAQKKFVHFKIKSKNHYTRHTSSFPLKSFEAVKNNG